MGPLFRSELFADHSSVDPIQAGDTIAEVKVMMRWSCTGRRMINLTTSVEVGCHSEPLVDSGAQAVCKRGRNSKRFLIKTLGTAALFALVSSVSFATAKRTVLS